MVNQAIGKGGERKQMGTKGIRGVKTSLTAQRIAMKMSLETQIVFLERSWNWCVK